MVKMKLLDRPNMPGVGCGRGKTRSVVAESRQLVADQVAYVQRPAAVFVRSTRPTSCDNIAQPPPAEPCILLMLQQPSPEVHV